MKKYVVVGVYTPNERGATGYAKSIEMFDSIEDAKAFVLEEFEDDKEYESDELTFDERRMLDCTTDKYHKVINAVCEDSTSGYAEWKIVEFDV